MRANMRSVSSTDEIFFVRIASAACKAVAKSSACGAVAAAPCVLFCEADGAEFCAVAGSPNISEAGRVDAARASGTVARKSRRFICEMVKGARRTRNPADRMFDDALEHLTRLFTQFHGSSRERGKEAPFRDLYFSYLPYFYPCRTLTRLRLAIAR